MKNKAKVLVAIFFAAALIALPGLKAIAAENIEQGGGEEGGGIADDTENISVKGEAKQAHEYLESRPGVKAEIERIKAGGEITDKDKDWIAANPEVAAEIERDAAWIKAHPEAATKVQEAKTKWQGMNPQERAKFLSDHPYARQEWRERHPGVEGRIENRGERLENRGERVENRGERVEQRGETLQRRGEQLESRGHEKAGARLERRGEKMERHGERVQNRGERMQNRSSPRKSSGGGRRGRR